MLNGPIPSAIRNPSRHPAARRNVDYGSGIDNGEVAVPDYLFSPPTAEWQKRRSLVELTIEEALEDPLIKLLNSVDGVSQAQFEGLLSEAARTLGAIATI